MKKVWYDNRSAEADAPKETALSAELLVRHCSPTLAGMKTGNLFVYPTARERELKACIRCWNQLLGKKGVRILPMRFQKGRALIYVYRPARLTADLQHTIARQLLQERGYGTEPSERCVVHLMKRLYHDAEFPHEIGLFLGYPPEDVYGFIENKANAYKSVGCWKVYGDAEAAQRAFARFKQCTDLYCAQYAKGTSLEQLTVAG